MHEQNGNFTTGSETAKVNANARKTTTQQQGWRMPLMSASADQICWKQWMSETEYRSIGRNYPH